MQISWRIKFLIKESAGNSRAFPEVPLIRDIGGRRIDGWDFATLA